MSIVEQFKEGKLDLSDCMYDVFLPIVSQENTNVILFQHLSMTEEGVFRALNGLSEKDYERFDKLRKMNTGMGFSLTGVKSSSSRAVMIPISFPPTNQQVE